MSLSVRRTLQQHIYKQKVCELYPGSALIISHSSIFTAQSGPINKSLVALSTQDMAALAMSLPPRFRSLQELKHKKLNPN